MTSAQHPHVLTTSKITHTPTVKPGPELSPQTHIKHGISSPDTVTVGNTGRYFIYMQIDTHHTHTLACVVFVHMYPCTCVGSVAELLKTLSSPEGFLANNKLKLGQEMGGAIFHIHRHDEKNINKAPCSHVLPLMLVQDNDGLGPRSVL